MTLNEKLEIYYQLQKETEEREEEMKSLKEEIVKEMEVEGITSQNTGLVEGKIINKTSFKYTDEVAILNYLRSHRLNNFISNKVNTTVMNKELKSKGALYEDLKNYCSENSSVTLSVKLSK